ncbi:MAG TPA: CVNH domain-containing protein [Candidatus Angelobacter sp.]|nr:CVNH domain-containing protein [Candidatus Angelobacter sp.]
MRYWMTLGAFAVLALVMWRPEPVRAMDTPPGSYLQTCRDVRVSGDRLYARCQNTSSRWVNTSLDDVYRCSGDIQNIDGRLTCDQSGRTPGGDYSASCRDIRMRFGWLYARCQNRGGSWVETSLPGFGRCTSGISNIDGQLVCNANQGRDWDHDGDDRRRYGPRGSYRETCRDIEVRGDQIRARCQDVGGNWIPSSLDFDRCVGDIVNDNGHLACTYRGGRTVPFGNYTETCSRIYVRGDNLRAMCQTADNRWVWSELRDWDDCRGGIWNDNGQLRCRRGDRD